MKYIQPLKMLMVAAAIVTPIYLMAPIPSLAAKPVKVTVCNVGSPPYLSIQDAVDDHNCHSINVPAGIFYENVTIGSSTDHRDITIRGVGPDSTIVDGDGSKRIPPALPAPVFAVGWSTVTLKGMTITGGETPPSSRPNGGGISNVHSTLTVKDCLITGNDASTEGGGIYISNTTLTVKDSTISGNSLPEIAP